MFKTRFEELNNTLSKVMERSEGKGTIWAIDVEECDFQKFTNFVVTHDNKIFDLFSRKEIDIRKVVFSEDVVKQAMFDWTQGRKPESITIDGVTFRHNEYVECSNGVCQIFKHEEEGWLIDDSVMMLSIETVAPIKKIKNLSESLNNLED